MTSASLQKQVVALRGQGKSWVEISMILGVNMECARSSYRRAVQKAKPVVTAVPRADVDPARAFAARRYGIDKDAQISALKAELKIAAEAANIEEAFRQIARETAPLLPPAPPLWTFTPSKDVAFETIGQMISDWHGFEEVKASRTRGFAEYSPEIMLRRVGNLVAAHAAIVERLSSEGRYVFPELFIPLLGDFVSGSIHDLEKHAHGSNVVLSAYNVAWLLAQTIRELSRLYPETYVAGVSGNHGRLPDNKRVPAKDPTRNWDYFVYMLLVEMCRELPNVHFWFPDAYSAQVEVRGWNFILNHGTNIRRWQGIPWYGMERWATKSTALEAQRGNIIHYRLLGQFHKSAQLPTQVGETFVNGSLIGANEYAVDEVTESDPPKQLLFGIHAKYGVTHRWPLNLLHDRADIPQFDLTRLRGIQEAAASGMGAAPVWRIGK